MPTHYLTDALVKTLTCPPDARYILYRDDGLTGLALRIGSGGKRTWLVDTRDAQQNKRQERLGPASGPGALRVAEARQRAEQFITELRNGTAPTALTLEQAVEHYIKAKHPAPTTARGMRQTISAHGRHLVSDGRGGKCAIKDKPLHLVTATEAVDACHAIWRNGAGSITQGNLFMKYARMVTNRAQVAPNPFARISEWETTPEEPTPLAPTDLTRIYAGLEALIVNARDFCFTALYTGFRPLAIVSMEWQHLSLDKGNASYYIGKKAPGFKGGRDWHYPLPESLAERLRVRHILHCNARFVFPNRDDPDKPANRYTRSVAMLREKLGIERFTPYSFRDTRGTFCERFFGDTIITQRLLNHRPDYRKSNSSKSTHRYVLSTTEQMRPYVERYADVVDELAGRKPMSDLVRRVFIENQAVAAVERESFAPDDAADADTMADTDNV